MQKPITGLTMSENDVIAILNHIDSGFKGVHDRMDGIQNELKACQEDRNKFHQEMVPKYNHHLCADKERRAFWGKIITTLTISALLAIGSAFWYVVWEVGHDIEAKKSAFHQTHR